MSSLFSRSVAFTPDRDIPDLKGKVILVTGGKLYKYDEIPTTN